jgi:hypothetical protein
MKLARLVDVTEKLSLLKVEILTGDPSQLKVHSLKGLEFNR